MRELGAALRVNPNTIRAVYRRLADNGYVLSRHGAGTVVVRSVGPSPAAGGARRHRVGDAPARRAGRASPPTRSPRPPTPPPPSASGPGEQVHVLFAECTTADAGYDAERLNREFSGQIEAEGTLLDELPERLDRFHYDLVATTTFHADEAQALVGGRVPVVAMLVGPGYVELVHEIAALPDGSRVGVVCASDRGTENIAETLSIAGHEGRRADLGDDPRRRAADADRPDGRPHPHVARGARPEARPAAPAPRARPRLDVRVRPRRRSSSCGARSTHTSAGPARGCAANELLTGRTDAPRPGPLAPNPLGLTSFARCGRSPWPGRRVAATDSNRSSGATGRWTRPMLAPRAGSPRA